MLVLDLDGFQMQFPVDQCLYITRMVKDTDHCNAGHFKLRQSFDQRLAGSTIGRCGGLAEQQQALRQDERGGQIDLLLLATREGGGISRPKPFLDAESVEPVPSLGQGSAPAHGYGMR
ncbi:hypothetical protein FHT91_000337 [Rhizobium sp. BK347]|nr:hypothetical protein [Rhizobium sp. BK252]MBB3400119.1 hypothetical protein [Rhizobium sp. BK289]MBB3412699.1 hypothetical protein [Rhizobium sp. BK284]MBB3480585.1 hypothetical protein [Rhizobium sp. BK347]